jgi:hypothetical protein
MRYLLIVIFVLSFFYSCKKDDPLYDPIIGERDVSAYYV